jgi:hypothetical protein
VGLPIFGISLHFLSLATYYSQGALFPLTHAVMAAHNVLGITFLVSASWHVISNRRALVRYIQSKQARYPMFSKELGTAAVLVTVLVVLALGHAFIAAH